ncbi:MAG: hypothetical protein ABSD63_09305 [Candidatus Korobacteraceae bacterium]|jgi:hypothetical protein
MKQAFLLMMLVLVTSICMIAKDKAPAGNQAYQRATYEGLHTYVAFSSTRLLTCLAPDGCITDQLIEAAATIKDDKGLEYTVPVPKANDPIRQFKAGDSVQFRLEKVVHKKELTLAQLQNRPLVPYPDTSQNVETYLFLVLPNGKEHKYDLGLSNPNDVVPAPTGGSTQDFIVQRLKATLPFLPTESLRLLCDNSGMFHTPYPQVYCDELKKREQAPATTQPTKPQ